MRFTKKIDNHYLIIHDWGLRNTFEDQNKEEFAIRKLGQIEDFEEDIRFDLLILFNALKNGIWIYDSNGIKMFTGHFQNGLVFNYCSQPSIQYGDGLYYLKDFGITWALTKEGLKDVA